MNGTALVERFEQLTAWLREGEVLWREHAFKLPVLSWEATYPQLAATLCALPLNDAERLAGDDCALAAFLQPCLPTAEHAVALYMLPQFEQRELASFAAEPRDIPGRKWRQISAFVSAVPAAPLPLLEWCAGKAHLARSWTRLRGQTADALEWDAALVAEGARLAQREQQPVTLHCVDVLAPAAAQFMRAEQQVVALHACGELHLQLLRNCAQQRPRALALVHCCYHLIPAPVYRPLSQAAQREDLRLGRDDLRTAVQDSVTSPPRVQRQRRQLQSWRLGFDLLQREVRGVDAYLSIPSLPPAALQQGFAEFCNRVARLKGFTLPAGIDYAPFERAGAQRFVEVTALDLARVLFRRALELWLVLDRALWLQEAGYAVEVGVFCQRELTPRNILICARR